MEYQCIQTQLGRQNNNPCREILITNLMARECLRPTRCDRTGNWDAHTPAKRRAKKHARLPPRFLCMYDSWTGDLSVGPTLLTRAQLKALAAGSQSADQI